MPVGEIVRRVAEFGARHVVLTGGEPMIMSDTVELCDALKARDHHLTLETAATVFKPVKLDLASLSPKLSNSTPRQAPFAALHERQRLNYGAIQQFIDISPEIQLKFVVSAPGDFDEVRAILDRLHGWRPSDVLLMPEGTDAGTLDSRSPWVAEMCKKTGFRFCPRLHVALYGHRRGT